MTANSVALIFIACILVMFFTIKRLRKKVDKLKSDNDSLTFITKKEKQRNEIETTNAINNNDDDRIKRMRNKNQLRNKD